MNRRHYLALLGATAVPTATTGTVEPTPEVGKTADAGRSAPGPYRDAAEWELRFVDEFGGRELDATVWTHGWGWGRRNEPSPTVIDPANVSVGGDRLRLIGTHTGDEFRSGAVNTKDTVTFGPGSYLEARVRFADRVGFLSAVWAKPNSETWPPEIDVVEGWHADDGTLSKSRHHLHYPTSTVPGDERTHESVGLAAEPDGDPTRQFHTYGVEWRQDRIVHSVDHTPVAAWRDTRILTAMGAGSPFYLMVSLEVGKLRTPDVTEPWGEAMVVDGIRLWAYRPDRQVADSASRDGYLWVRSADGALATFTFRTSGGNVRLVGDAAPTRYWVGDDGRVGGGAVARRTGLPGFRYDGEITQFSHDGPLEAFVDDERVDPATLGDRAEHD